MAYVYGRLFNEFLAGTDGFDFIYGDTINGPGGLVTVIDSIVCSDDVIEGRGGADLLAGDGTHLTGTAIGGNDSITAISPAAPIPASMAPTRCMVTP